MGSERAAGERHRRHRDRREDSPASRRRHQRALVAPPRVPATRPRRSPTPWAPQRSRAAAASPGALGTAREHRAPQGEGVLGLTNAPTTGRPASGPASGSGAASNRVLFPFPGSRAEGARQHWGSARAHCGVHSDPETTPPSA